MFQLIWWQYYEKHFYPFLVLNHVIKKERKKKKSNYKSIISYIFLAIDIVISYFLYLQSPLRCIWASSQTKLKYSFQKKNIRGSKPEFWITCLTFYNINCMPTSHKFLVNHAQANPRKTAKAQINIFNFEVNYFICGTLVGSLLRGLFTSSTS